MPNDPKRTPEDKDTPTHIPGMPPKAIEIRLAIFFDGTGNSSTNTATYKKLGETYFTGSYHSDYTNIWRLYQHMKGYKKNAKGAHHWHKMYLPGVGTTSYKFDDPSDYATGMGDTGIPAKANEAIIRSLAHITNIAKKGDAVRIYFDVFGFSRGAATARHFIHRVLFQGDDVIAKVLHRDHKILAERVEVIFAGLFDTVSSYGILDFSNDTGQLHLDAVRHVKGLAYHLCASDEYRENFSLTNIKSAIDAGVGVELYLPGAHADVGGGYPDSMAETVTTMSIENNNQAVKLDKDWLVDKGYCIKGEVKKYTYGAPPLAPVIIYKNVMSRIKVLNDYTYIPMNLMANKAELHDLVFDRTTMKRRYAITGRTLSVVKRKIDAYAKKVDADVNDNAMVWTSKGGAGAGALPRLFRRLYCHYSANEEKTGMSTNWRNEPTADRRRNIYDG